MSIVHQSEPLTDLASVAGPPITTAADSPGAATPTTTEERRAALQAIAREVSVCTRCPLHVGRTNAVPGEGHPDTEVVFVGEGPGFNEDQQGRPFVGAAGRFLTELIESVGWRRGDVFITNVVKCRPPGNRDPEPDEIAACAPYLRRQLEVLDPALIVTLGRFSMRSFMPGARIAQAHGTVQPVDPATGARAARAYAMYHPASAFRQQSLRHTIQLDMTGIPRALIDARRGRGEAIDEATAGEPAGSEATRDPSDDARSEADGPLVAVAAVEPDPDDQLSLFR